MSKPVAVVGLLMLSGCSLLVDSDSVRPRQAGDGGSDGDGGGGPGFTLSSRALSVSLPLDGQNLLEIEVTRTGGYTGDVVIDAVGPPQGYEGEAVRNGYGNTPVALVVGASAPLEIGDTFDLVLMGTGEGVDSQMVVVPVTVTGKPGTIDASFGIVRTQGLAGADAAAYTALHIAGNGDIYAAGTYTGGLGPVRPMTSRYGADGSFDSGWNGGQTVTESWCDCPGQSTFVGFIGQQVGGKLVWGGTSFGSTTGQGYNVTAIRYGNDGNKDELLFGATGPGITHVNIADGSERGFDGLVLDDDRIVVVGQSGSDTFVTQLEPNGEPDLDFATVGYLTTSVLSGSEQAKAVAVDDAGRLLLAVEGEGVSSADTALVRIADGALDTTFQDNGFKIVGDPTAKEDIIDLEILSDGRILTLGTSTISGDADLQVRRFLSDGSPDPEFGVDGVADIIRSGSSEKAMALVVLPDGRLLVAGRSENADLLVRLLRDGQLDETLGDGGAVVVNLGEFASMRTAIFYDAGRILVGGADVEGNSNYAIIAIVWI